MNRFKKISSIVTSLVLLTGVLAGSALAKESSVEDKPDIVVKTDKIMKSSKDKKTQLENLKKAGWEQVGTIEEPDIVPMSSGTCGTLTNNALMKQWDSSSGRYLYLAYVDWDFKSSCSYDNGSGKVPDGLALAVIKDDGTAVNKQALYANIDVRDEDGDYHNVGYVQNYSSSGAAFAFDDNDGIADYVGDNGQAWFYLEKPTTGTSYYIRSTWEHNWITETANATTTVSIGYPYAASFQHQVSPSTVSVHKWQVADQDQVYFN